MNASLKTNSNLAIISLVFGILGWTLLFGIGSIVAIITGHMARSEIRRNPDTIEGDGLAMGGLILGWSNIIICVLGSLLVILLFGGIAALIGWAGLSGNLN